MQGGVNRARTYPDSRSVQVATIETFSEMWRETSTEADILHTLSCAGEFSNIKASVTRAVDAAFTSVYMQAARAYLFLGARGGDG